MTITTRTPFRVSFFGGGTDYPSWYRENGGEVLATTIDKYAYLTLKPVPRETNPRFRVEYSREERVNSLEEIEHPVIHAALKHAQWQEGLHVSYAGDLLARSGIGSSSSFTVGFLHALSLVKGQSSPTKRELVEKALFLEQELLKEVVGSQDQISAAYGGFNHIQFSRTGNFEVTPVPLTVERKKDIESSLFLHFTGTSRIAAVIAEATISEFSKRAPVLKRMQAMVREALEIFGARHYEPLDLGELLHESWLLKQSLSPLICPAHIEPVYEVARRAGALGGKLLGAGGGGFLLLVIPPSKVNQVQRSLGNSPLIPVRFENEGSVVVENVPLSLELQTKFRSVKSAADFLSDALLPTQ